MLLYTSVCLRTRQDTISYSFICIVQKLELETGDRDRDRGTPKLLYSETMVLRNYGTPKLLRNWGIVELRNYSEITPKLVTGTAVIRNYFEITPKLLRNWGPKLGTVGLRNYSETGDRDRDRGTPKLLRNWGPGPWYSEIMDRDCGTPKLGNRGTSKLLRN